MAERERAVAARLRADAVRARSTELCNQAEIVSSSVVESVRHIEGVHFGEHGDAFSLRLARLPVVIGLVRQELGGWLERRGVARGDAVDITLACSEACANAIEHPMTVERQAVEVRAAVQANEVEIVVRDFGSWAVETAAEAGTRGRGLEMIRALMDEVAVRRIAHGTQVTMRRRLESDRPA
jgi:anti-sigma regulatory factor (Ser/Thr protein kinase)